MTPQERAFCIAAIKERLAFNGLLEQDDCSFLLDELAAADAREVELRKDIEIKGEQIKLIRKYQCDSCRDAYIADNPEWVELFRSILDGDSSDGEAR